MKYWVIGCKVITRIIKYILLFFLLAVILSSVMQYFRFDRSHNLVQSIYKINQQIQFTTKQYFPTKIQGNRDISSYISILSLLILLFLNGRIYELLYRLQLKLAQPSIEIGSAEDKVTLGTNNDSVKNRKELLSDLFSIKKRLNESGQFLAFLAIDVCNSTDMKIDEDKLDVEYSFDQYMELVGNKLRKNGVISDAWTPDGIMACFHTVDQALSAAKSVLSELPNFNKTVKTIAKDFHVRCGINAGFVFYDTSIPLERYSDRVIDIAGHLQKYAKIDSIYLPKELVKPIEDSKHLNKINEMIDGVEVYEWQLNSSASKS